MKTSLNIILTGNGKGKTTSALGMVLRALGNDQRVCVIQFIKSPDSDYGEKRMLDRLGVENYQMGAGFTWVADKQKSLETAAEAWAMACKARSVSSTVTPRGRSICTASSGLSSKGSSFTVTCCV